MIKSMTSFGRAQGEEGSKYLFSIEMKSVNNRYLDINIRLPKFIISLEEEFRKIISKRLNRGKVDVFINYKAYEGSNLTPKLDLNLAKKYYSCLLDIEKNLNVQNDITVSKIAKLPEVITLEGEEEDLDKLSEEIRPLLNSALDMMVDMREKEGEKLKEDILIKLKDVKSEVCKIEELSVSVPQNYKKKLEDRIKELTTGITIDEERVAMEVAIFADKAAVDEELTRLYSHIDQMEKNLELSEPIGRKLDFIIQEMNRETNTIGSKSNDMNMTNHVINIKNTLEKIREQVQNIE
ncbi:MAG: YicC family protein [Clostridiales bacterium]|nr:YicC family protein [Clostridiales bacterium]